MLMLAAAVLIISIASSTAAQRREAQERMSRWNVPLWIVNALLLAILLFPWNHLAPL